MNAVEILDKMIAECTCESEKTGLIAARDAVAQSDDAKNAARYEYLRRLNVHQFQELFIKNLSAEFRFDDLVDAAIAKQQESE